MIGGDTQVITFRSYDLQCRSTIISHLKSLNT